MSRPGWPTYQRSVRGWSLLYFADSGEISLRHERMHPVSFAFLSTVSERLRERGVVEQLERIDLYWLPAWSARFNPNSHEQLHALARICGGNLRVASTVND